MAQPQMFKRLVLVRLMFVRPMLAWLNVYADFY